MKIVIAFILLFIAQTSFADDSGAAFIVNALIVLFIALIITAISFYYLNKNINKLFENSSIKDGENLELAKAFSKILIFIIIWIITFFISYSVSLTYLNYKWKKEKEDIKIELGLGVKYNNQSNATPGFVCSGPYCKMNMDQN